MAQRESTTIAEYREQILKIAEIALNLLREVCPKNVTFIIGTPYLATQGYLAVVYWGQRFTPFIEGTPASTLLGAYENLCAASGEFLVDLGDLGKLKTVGDRDENVELPSGGTADRQPTHFNN